MTELEVARAMHLSTTLEVECCGNCTNKFALKDGLPWAVFINGDKDQPHLRFFCSDECILVLMQPENCMGGGRDEENSL
jgi:hypothetical protein